MLTNLFRTKFVKVFKNCQAEGSLHFEIFYLVLNRAGPKCLDIRCNCAVKM